MNTMWRSTLVTLIICLIGTATMALVWSYRAPDLVFGCNVGLMVLGLGLMAELLFRRNPRAESWSSFIFLSAVITIIAMICLNHEEYIRGHYPFEPFLGIKIAAVIIPMILPPNRRFSWLALFLLAVVPLERYFAWDSAAQASVGIQEPWITVLFVLISGIIYHYRVTLLGLRERELESKVKSKAMHRFAHLILGAQHLINTPLQKIEIVGHLINTSHPDTTDLVGTFESSLESIKRVNSILRFVDSKVRWDLVRLPSDADALEVEVKEFIAELEPEGIA